MVGHGVEVVELAIGVLPDTVDARDVREGMCAIMRSGSPTFDKLVNADSQHFELDVARGSRVWISDLDVFGRFAPVDDLCLLHYGVKVCSRCRRMQGQNADLSVEVADCSAFYNTRLALIRIASVMRGLVRLLADVRRPRFIRGRVHR